MNTGAALPRLRSDLRVEPGAAAAGGMPTWIITDTLRHKYFQIDAEGHLLLVSWKEAHTLDELIAIANERYDQQIGRDFAEDFVQFVRRHMLCNDDSSESWRSVYRASLASRPSVMSALLHNYLFFKVPLFRPQALLMWLVPIIGPYLSKAAAKGLALLALVGLFLVHRHWNEFIGTANEIGSVGGVLLVATTLFVVKAFHELGHAVAAVHFGCRVPVVGVAFMLMTPMLYADVTDAWRLVDRRKRLFIDLAGVIAELVIACAATIAWLMLPEGNLKVVAFICATTSWIMSVVINLNPLMRFDGYYALSDFLGIENLQQRSFAFAKWKLRRLLFAPRLEAPEALPLPTQRLLVAYAVTLWIYRLVLYAGIAALVYSYFFKLLGLLLFSVEIYVFILGPVIGEFREWFRFSRNDVSKSRAAVSLALASLFLIAIAIPLPAWVSVPATFTRATVSAEYPLSAGQLESLEVKAGQSISSQQVIAKLRAPELELRMKGAAARIKGLNVRLNRIAADGEERARTLVLLNELKTAQTALDALAVEERNLVLRAAEDGVVLELDRDLRPGSWVSLRTQVALVGSEKATLAGYVSEADVEAIDLGTSGVFVPEDIGEPNFPVRVVRIDRSGISAIGQPELASTFGGAIKSKMVSGQLMAARNYFYIEFTPVTSGKSAPGQVVVGTVLLSAAPRSLGLRVLRGIASVMIKEAAF